MNYPFTTCLLTNGSQRTEIICKRLAESGFKPDHIVHTMPLNWMECKRRYKNLNILNPLNIMRVTRMWLTNNLSKQSVRKHFLNYSKAVHFSEMLNGSCMQQLLMKLNIDFIIIGDSGILQQPVIGAARIGVINSHPAILPFARGTGVVGRSLQRGIAAGATIHFVNSGIDEGDIIKRRLVDASLTFNSLSDVEIKADNLAIDLLIETLVGDIASGNIPKRIDQLKKYNYCRWLDESARKSMDQQVKEGLPSLLFLKWKPLCKPGTLDLKDEIMDIVE